jgi:hypothetical protein
MNNEKNPDKEKIRDQAKDATVFAGGIAGLLVIAAFFWILSQPVRTRFLLKAVNKVLEQSGDPRRLEELPPEKNRYFGIGTWFSVRSFYEQRAQDTEKTKAIIFPFIGEGTFFPCAAVLTQDGKVKEFIPLNNHGERMIKQISPSALKIYAKRIERTGL